jgi:hypothetical protein
MPSPRSRRSAKPPASNDSALAAWLRSCNHPRRKVLDALRAIVRRAAPALVEEVKWNAPSFRLPGGEHCITCNVGARDRVRLVFHRGARAKDGTRPKQRIDDGGLCEWPAPDRAVATFRSLEDVEASAGALVKFVRAWVAASGSSD